VWKKENDTEVLKCWNLEQVLEADALGNAPPVMLTLYKLLPDGAMVEGVVVLDVNILESFPM